MKKVIVLLVFSFFSKALLAQSDSLIVVEKPKAIKKEDKPLKFNLNDDGSHFFQVTFLNQTWIRFNESNPGTTVMGETQDKTFDIGLRRTRIQMFGQVTDRAFVYFQFGQNNFNRNAQYGNRKIAAFFHDAVGEYRLTNKSQLKIGAGLTIANGLSRFSQPSVGTILALDVPVFAQATVDQTDLFSRKLSIYARGQIGKIDYRVSLTDPFPVTSNGLTTPAISSTNATFATKGHNKQYQAYVMYQFFEKEGHLTPYMTGTNLGKKKILNVGGGIIYQKDAMWLKEGVDTVKQNMLLWSAETFIDLPLNKDKGNAITAYVGYFNYDFGTNYVRTGAQMNPADGKSIAPNISTVSGGGNGWPMVGTGNIIYSQFGYLFNKDLLGDLGTLQPYVTYQRNNFTYLNDPVNVYDIGVNWLLNGHRAKISFDYQSRPVYNTDLKVETRRGSYILQYQIFI
jgi:hypothetical protein